MSAAPATTSTTDEHVLLRELANYKFIEPPTSNKILHLRDLHPWLKRLRSTFSRFPDVGQIIYSTVPATDANTKFKAKAYPEISVKLEDDSKHSKEEARDKVAREFLTEKELYALKEQMGSFGGVTNLIELVEFLKDCPVAKLIMANPKLLAYVAPMYVKSGDSQKTFFCPRTAHLFGV